MGIGRTENPHVVLRYETIDRGKKKFQTKKIIVENEQFTTCISYQKELGRVLMMYGGW